MFGPFTGRSAFRSRFEVSLRSDLAPFVVVLADERGPERVEVGSCLADTDRGD